MLYSIRHLMHATPQGDLRQHAALNINSTTLGLWPDILIDPEEIVRIVFLLDL